MSRPVRMQNEQEPANSPGILIGTVTPFPMPESWALLRISSCRRVALLISRLPEALWNSVGNREMAMLSMRDHGVSDYADLRDMDATDVGELSDISRD